MDGWMEGGRDEWSYGWMEVGMNGENEGETDEWMNR